jgi:predicted CoA-binding protein
VSASRPTVAVIGASNDRSKYGNKAVRAFRNQGWEVYPVNPSLSEVEGIPASPSVDALPIQRLDRASFYVPPRVGLGIIESLAKIEVGEVWLNPGSGSRELLARAEALGLNVIQGCSILDIGEDPADF